MILLVIIILCFVCCLNMTKQQQQMKKEMDNEWPKLVNSIIAPIADVSMSYVRKIYREHLPIGKMFARQPILLLSNVTSICWANLGLCFSQDTNHCFLGDSTSEAMMHSLTRSLDTRRWCSYCFSPQRLPYSTKWKLFVASLIQITQCYMFHRGNDLHWQLECNVM